MGRPFAYELLRLLCWSCAHPVDIALSGGPYTCGGCGAQAGAKPRAQVLPQPQHRRPGPQAPELRAQDGRPLLPPPGVAFLWEGSNIPAHRHGEALVAWQSARRRAAQGDVGAGEEIVMLARELAGAAERAGDLNKCRAFIESSLEAAPFPRHRAILLGMLVRAAVRGRDFEAAERWLQHFEGGYADLESDSEWRVSTAVVATARRDYTTVLSALGRSFGEIALQDALDAQGVLFRAHALEQLGQLPEATLQISQLLERGGSAMRTGLEQMVKMYGALGLCPGSLGQVLAQRESSARASAGVGKLVLGAILILVPLLPAGIGVIIGASLFLSGEATLDEPGAWVGAVVPIAMSGIFFLSFGLWGIRTVLAGLRERAAFSRGVRATARVLSARPTGVSINDQPEMLIELEVALMPPVRSSLRRVIHPGEMHAVMPGTVLHVRVDPAHPETAVLDH